MIRPAKREDMNWLLEMAADLSAQYYPELRFDRKKTQGLITECISSPQHFAWVGDKSALFAATTPNHFAERNSCLVLALTGPEGLPLLREFKRWVDSRRAIRGAVIIPEAHEERYETLLTKLGFVQRGGRFIYSRYTHGLAIKNMEKDLGRR